MALPLKLRNYYDKVVTPVTGMAGQLTVMGGRHRGGSSLTGTNVQHMVQSYVTMNIFLSRFLEHVRERERERERESNFLTFHN